jgi:type IV pilus assembly protein PilW
MGFSLVEMMVAVAIGMILIVVITNLISRHEATRRTLASGNESTLSASFVSYTLDREIRSAGSGFSGDKGQAYGCRLRAARGGTQLLPSPSPLPAPFQDTSLQSLVLAPVLIYPGIGTNGSDVLVVNAGTAGGGETNMNMRPLSATVSQVRFDNTIGMRGNDLMLAVENGRNCLISQVQAPFTGGAADTVNFAGTYYASSIAGTALSDYTNARFSNLGNAADNPPRFQLFGLAANNRLVSYDALQTTGLTTTQLVADGILDMRFRYGIDTTAPNGDGVFDEWALPTGTFAPASLVSANFEQMRRILVLRVGLIVRDDLVERDDVSAASVTLFQDLPAAMRVTRTLSANERRLRIRTIEFTVPLRNAISTVRQ